MAKVKDNLPAKAGDEKKAQTSDKKLWMRIAVLVVAVLILLTFIILPLFS